MTENISQKGGQQNRTKSLKSNFRQKLYCLQMLLLDQEMTTSHRGKVSNKVAQLEVLQMKQQLQTNQKTQPGNRTDKKVGHTHKI